MRVLLSGYYGFGNLGDDALLAIIVAELRTRHPLAQIEVLSAEPALTAHALGVEAVPRADLAAVRAAIGRADVVLSGGGGLLQNATSMRSLLYYAGIIRTAIRSGKPAMIFAQSIGPLDFWGKQTVRECCKGLAAATVRDERSRALLAPLVSGVVVERTADPVFLYQPPIDYRPAGDDGFDGAPLAVVAPRKSAQQTEMIERLAAAADRLHETHGARIAFVAFGGAPDAEIATAIIRKCRSRPMLLPFEDLDAIAAVVARAQLVIGVRLHALILAARFGVPFLAVPYDPKVSALCDELAYPLEPLFTPGERGRQSDPSSIVDRAWTERAVLAQHLRERLGPMQRLAGANFDALDRLVRLTR